MNLVNLIESQLSDQVMGKLSSLIGASDTATRSAAGAAVPALLSGLSSLCSSPGGAQKLMSALGKFDGRPLDSLADMLTDKPDAALEQGSGLLNSLMGGNILSGIAGAVAKFAGIGGGSVQKLLGCLMPLALGSIAKRFAGKAISPEGLSSMFSEQKANIADALPSGFSLDSIPGLNQAASAVRAVTGQAQQTGASVIRWLIPVGALALVALIVWAMIRPSTNTSPTVMSIPTVPNAAQLSADLTHSFKSMTDSLSSIKDASSATAAVRNLKEVSDKLDGMKPLIAKLPESEKGEITETIKTNLTGVDDQFAKLLWIPGVGATLKPVLDQIMSKMASMGAVQVPQTANASGELAGLTNSITEALAQIKDAASGEAALPKLKEINQKLDASKNMLAELPEKSRSTIAPLLRVALSKLKELADHAVSTAALGPDVKSTVDSIMGKLESLTA